MYQDRFIRAWEHAGGDAQAAAQVYAELGRRYAAPGRHYHSPRHIHQCLRQLDAAWEEIANPFWVELALWFHDAIYDTKAKDNEARSADLFLSYAGDMPCRSRQAVSRLIMATVHPNEPVCPDEQAIVDIDLMSFALPWPEFLRDSRDVRAEFDHMAHEDFVAGQCNFLRLLLARKQFYLTPYFHQHFEHKARANLERYLTLMDPGQYTPLVPLAPLAASAG